MMTKHVRVEYREIKVADNSAIEPGASRRFCAWPQGLFRPDELLLPGDGTLRLDSVEIADRSHAFNVPGERTAASEGVPAISLHPMQDRAMTQGHRILITLTNTGHTPVKARPILYGNENYVPWENCGLSPTGRTFLTMHPVDLEDAIHVFQIPGQRWYDKPMSFCSSPAELLANGCVASAVTETGWPRGVSRNGRGSTRVIWRSPWSGRITKLRIKCDCADMDITDFSSGNIALLASEPLPVVLFRQPRTIGEKISVSPAREVSFSFIHPGDGFETVEIDLEFQTHSDPEIDALNGKDRH